MNKIRSFREDPTLPNKILTALTYVVFGWIVTKQSIYDYGNLLSIFMILGIVLWIFVIQKRTLKYFIRYHIIQALMLNVALCAALWLLISTLELFASLPIIQIGMDWVMIALFKPINVFNTLQASVKDLVVMTTALYLAYTSARGQYTELPWITDGVRHWL